MRTTDNNAAQAAFMQTKFKSKTTAYLLWFFLGAIGAHQFYLKRYLHGVTMGFLWVVGLTVAIIGGVSNEAKLATFGTLIWVIWAILCLIDMIAIPSYVNNYNQKIYNTFKNYRNND